MNILKRLLLVGSLLLFSPCFAYIDQQAIESAKVFASMQNPLAKLPIVLDMPQDFDDPEVIKLFSDKLLTFNNEEIIIRDEGLGGNLFLVRDLSRAILESESQGNNITIEVTGIAASGNAYITCYANHVKVDDGGSLLFHDAGGEDSLFLGLIQYRRTARDMDIIANEVDDNLNTCKMAGVLNDKDISVIKSGDDVVFLMQQGKLIRRYEKDMGSFSVSGLDALGHYLSNIVAVLGLLGLWLLVWRRAGK